MGLVGFLAGLLMPDGTPQRLNGEKGDGRGTYSHDQVTGEHIHISRDETANGFIEHITYKDTNTGQKYVTAQEYTRCPNCGR